MINPTPRLLLWTIMLAIAFSPLQVSLAKVVAPHEHAVTCAHAQPHSGHDNMQLAHDICDQGHSEQCIDHPGCLMQNTFTSLQPVPALKLLDPIGTALRHARASARLRTIYTDSLTRPPKY